MSENILESANAGEEGQAIYAVAKAEGVKSTFLLKQVALGRVAILQRAGKQPVGIGENLRTRINANIGTSAEVFYPKEGVKKAMVAEKYGADTITDLSMGGPIDEIRRNIAGGRTLR